ncbi:hypothetical protein [Vibrio coralliilyticus]|uniref:hypothetical protein n=1 Tax=Vibrio coralliilyticus TaxID=190893 RepID=UPI0018518D60|nr:hypothetical protein [Vibrio coralliilyticus]NUW67438.1 hypothetical protein [Vibrio coralliilyticus]
MNLIPRTRSIDNQRDVAIQAVERLKQIERSFSNDEPYVTNLKDNKKADNLMAAIEKAASVKELREVCKNIKKAEDDIGKYLKEKDKKAQKEHDLKAKEEGHTGLYLKLDLEDYKFAIKKHQNDPRELGKIINELETLAEKVKSGDKKHVNTVLDYANAKLSKHHKTESTPAPIVDSAPAPAYGAVSVDSAPAYGAVSVDSAPAYGAVSVDSAPAYGAVSVDSAPAPAYGAVSVDSAPAPAHIWSDTQRGVDIHQAAERLKLKEMSLSNDEPYVTNLKDDKKADNLMAEVENATSMKDLLKVFKKIEKAEDDIRKYLNEKDKKAQKEHDLKAKAEGHTGLYLKLDLGEYKFAIKKHQNDPRELGKIINELETLAEKVKLGDIKQVSNLIDYAIGKLDKHHKTESTPTPIVASTSTPAYEPPPPAYKDVVSRPPVYKDVVPAPPAYDAELEASAPTAELEASAPTAELEASAPTAELEASAPTAELEASAPTAD